MKTEIQEMMENEGGTYRKPVFLTVLRRIIFAGLVILIAWLALLALRGGIPDRLIDQMNEEGQNEVIVSHDSWDWDWDTSIRTGDPVSTVAGERLGNTLGSIALTGLFSLVIAAILLFLGSLIAKATTRPGWLAKLRSILRLVLVSGGASTPASSLGTILTIFFMTTGWGWSTTLGSTVSTLSSIFFASLLPAWLLVQAGHGEIANLNNTISMGMVIRHLAVKMIIRLFRLIGVVIVVTITSSMVIPQGFGTLLRQSLATRDFPVIFSIVWIFVLIVVLVKLIADLIEIAYHRSDMSVTANTSDEESPLKFALPKGWLIACMVLVGIILLVAIFGPMLAPYGYNAIFLDDRLTGPSSTYLLGTDNLGRDILSRLLYATRLDIFAGLTCAGILAVLATAWAMLAGYFRKRNSRWHSILEDLILLPGNVITAVPWLVLVWLMMSMINRDIDHHTILATLVVSLVLLPRGVAMVREAYLTMPEEEGWLRRLLRAVPVMCFFTVGGSILYLASTSYYGFGINPPVPELGILLSGTGRQYMHEAPWMAQWPSLWLTLLLLIWVMTGDAILEKLGFHSKAVWAKAME
jgi:ABC-type dipeptide/oligopeptide/nickel transport system permease subunit/ABC-type dipeptide/oligopeptide/nickel transport system permease component